MVACCTEFLAAGKGCTPGRDEIMNLSPRRREGKHAEETTMLCHVLHWRAYPPRPVRYERGLLHVFEEGFEGAKQVQYVKKNGCSKVLQVC